MNRLIENIDKQIDFNQGKNIFLDNLDEFKFTNETIQTIYEIDKLNLTSKLYLIDYVTDKTIESFYKINQYYTFSLKSKDDLKNIYFDLFEKIETKTFSIDHISKGHFENLKFWLKENNLFAEKIYNSAEKILKPVACAEYNPDLQIKILKIDIQNLQQPVLDIGCGSKGFLVNYLKELGVEVIGIDRLTSNKPFLISTDWLEYNYGEKKWGTIVSNLGFSNHFIHHNLRTDGNFVEYAKTYMKILNSLKINGCFHYAPELPFIEQYLDSNHFELKKHAIENSEFKTAIIKRLS